MIITTEMREKATQQFRAILADRVVWTSTHSWPSVAGLKLSEMADIIEAAWKMEVTEANPDSLTVEECVEIKDCLGIFRRLEMDEEAFNLIIEFLKKIGVEEEHFKDIKLPKE